MFLGRFIKGLDEHWFLASYYAMIGLSYTFGSIYNNIVNPRFGSIYSKLLMY